MEIKTYNKLLRRKRAKSQGYGTDSRRKQKNLSMQTEHLEQIVRHKSLKIIEPGTSCSKVAFVACKFQLFFVFDYQHPEGHKDSFASL